MDNNGLQDNATRTFRFGKTEEILGRLKEEGFIGQRDLYDLLYREFAFALAKRNLQGREVAIVWERTLIQFITSLFKFSDEVARSDYPSIVEALIDDPVIAHDAKHALERAKSSA